ncbi:extracellular solute-binding protein [Tengunoibacter tsumagoiensis]|uniref:Sugar ABC transporter substrate-binding protein n=1 Tax=Tengunoibacter tsumagoiensis TaxID=2014871 RepID=A0A402A124_9CHLR|nr:extracellular solute-binding protein [Tengunoibacter tsumagoiensis]GCE12823.1 sugar ABC transporter substrate-binding protein [Tengunoibacter tsumagoiensis]
MNNLSIYGVIMKHRRSRTIAASLSTLLVLLTVILSACGGSSTSTTSGPVTLNYWYTEGTAEAPVITKLIGEFEKQNPDIKINAQYQPFDQTQSKFANAAQSNTAPDVLRSDVGWIAQFASTRYLLPLDQYVSETDQKDYLPNALAYGKYDGHLYALPQVTDFLAIQYNKAILAKAGITSAPKTMSDFEAASKKIVESGAAKYAFETSGASYFTLPFLWSFGGGMIDANNKVLVNNAGSVAGLEFLTKLQNQDKVMPGKIDFNNGYNNMVNDLKDGTTAMIFNGPWETSNILTGSAFADKTNLGIAAIPAGPTGVTGSPTGGHSYVAYAGTKHPAEAAKFINFMSSTSSQVEIATANHTLPTRESAYKDAAVTADPIISAFYAIRNSAVSRPVIPQGGQLFTDFDPNIQAALGGSKTPADALNAVAEKWQQLLASK